MLLIRFPLRGGFDLGFPLGLDLFPFTLSRRFYIPLGLLRSSQPVGFRLGFRRDTGFLGPSGAFIRFLLFPLDGQPLALRLRCFLPSSSLRFSLCVRGGFGGDPLLSLPSLPIKGFLT